MCDLCDDRTLVSERKEAYKKAVEELTEALLGLTGGQLGHASSSGLPESILHVGLYWDLCGGHQEHDDQKPPRHLSDFQC